MSQRLQDPMYYITSLHCEDKNVFFNKCQDALPHFAALAVVIDAYDNYRDLLYQLDDFSFAATEDVRLRFATLHGILDSILDGHAHCTETKEPPQLLWNTKINARAIVIFATVGNPSK